MRRTWLRQIRRTLDLDRAPTAPVRARTRLGFESLEDRSVPAVFLVTSLTDVVAPADGVLTLREAVIDANATAEADDITFDAGLNGTLALTGGQMTISAPVTITANGAANTVLDAQHSSRIFDIRPMAGDVTLDNLAFKNGLAQTKDDGGGAVLFESSGTLTVSQSAFSGNSTTKENKGGAIYTFSGRLLIDGSIFTNNSADRGGGIWSTVGDITVNQCTFSGNHASGGDGIGRTAFGANSLRIQVRAVMGGSDDKGKDLFHPFMRTRRPNPATEFGNHLAGPARPACRPKGRQSPEPTGFDKAPLRRRKTTSRREREQLPVHRREDFERQAFLQSRGEAESLRVRVLGDRQQHEPA